MCLSIPKTCQSICAMSKNSIKYFGEQVTQRQTLIGDAFDFDIQLRMQDRGMHG
ncbi:hypothetical protein BGZ60DRAFT_405743 [Tricladium varicosporioides]|nr:hypothetical protein BGZ60DRAFT_405743 [Hymenoscyphus varicosporioides]